jgi:hypothetical protein
LEEHVDFSDIPSSPEPESAAGKYSKRPSIDIIYSVNVAAGYQVPNVAAVKVFDAPIKRLVTRQRV